MTLSTSTPSGRADEPSGGLKLRLSEVPTQAEAPSRPPVADARPLAADDAERLLRRLPPLAGAEERPFALREGTAPPPRTGKTIETPFPPEAKEAPPAVEKAPLEVLRFLPEADVPLAPHVNITFSQPMVALTSHGELAKGAVPVRLEPEPEGAWRWVGTKTLLFEARSAGTEGEGDKTRLPMATKYMLTVPVGTTSASGSRLPKTLSFTFSTPPLTVKAFHPQTGPQPREPLIVLLFDQRIDPKAVLEFVEVSAGERKFPLRPASAEEVEKDERAQHLLRDAPESRWLALRVQEPLPAAAQVEVTLLAGAPSAEGPLTTEKPRTFRLRTYDALKVVEHYCGWRGNKEVCRPGTSWGVRFTTPLDSAAFDKAQVKVSPEIPGFEASVRGQYLTLQVQSRARTRYEVTLDASLRDTFGQSLGEPAVLHFEVGPAVPRLQALGGPLVVLDPSGEPRYSVFTVNHRALKVSAHRVTPEDWQPFLAFLRGFWSAQDPKAPPGRRVLSRSVEVTSFKDDELVETEIDLRPALEEGGRHVVLVVEPTAQPNPDQKQAAAAWIQSTRIALDAFVSNDELLAWATDLKDGAPLEDVEVTLVPQRTAAVTGKDGLARIALNERETPGPSLIVARRGDDLAFLAEDEHDWQERGSWRKSDGKDFLAWHVFDDRGIYRPGEEVRLKGWIRRVGHGPRGDVGPLDGAAERVSYRVASSQGREVHQGEAELGPLGGFDLVFRLPPQVELGDASIQLEAKGGSADVAGTSHQHSFQVQEFRRPEYEVSVAADPGPHFAGGKAEATVSAKYYAGGGLGGTPVTWRVTSTPGHYSPPGRDDFTFGTWVPWWRFHDFEDAGAERYVEAFSGRTDASGAHRLRIELDPIEPPRPWSVRAEASVQDVNRQSWSGSAALLVHPADLYVGMRSERSFVEEGKPLRIDVIACDLDGKAVPGVEVELSSARLDWVEEKGEWKQVEKDPQLKKLRSGAEPVTALVETAGGGAYRVRTRLRDAEGRSNQSELTLWVAGGKLPPQRNVEQEEVTLIPDRKEYQPGDTAEVLVLAPFAPAEALVTLRRSGLASTERFRLETASHTLRVRIEEAHIPNVHVQVDLVGASLRAGDDQRPKENLPPRPAFASGSVDLSVPPLRRKLAVTARPETSELEPGAETSVEVEVRDASGSPLVGAEVALVVVDEAVLALTGHDFLDPTGTFYYRRNADVRDSHLRRSVVLREFVERLALAEDVQEVLTLGAPALALDAGAGGGQGWALQSRTMYHVGAPAEKSEAGADSGSSPIRMRADLNALAVFVPAVLTDAQGHARVPVKLPDSLTRYRVAAVAVAGGKQFGRGESAVTARLSLMVRPSPPRFLNYGDRCELPVVVQNQTEKPLEVDVAVRAANLELLAGNGRRLTVPASDRVEVRFLAAARRAGKASVQVSAASGAFADAATVTLPVWTPATTEAFAVYGEIAAQEGPDSAAVVQRVLAPEDAIAEFGGLEVTSSSTALHALTDAVLYLTSYPFECTEQIASRLLAVAALRDVLAAFESEGLPPPDEVVAAVRRDLERLQGLQSPDGSFGFWRRGAQPWPYLGVHAAHALARAFQKDFQVPEAMLQRSAKYLSDIRRHFPQDYSPEHRRSIEAYALYVRRLMAGRDSKAAGDVAAQARTLLAEIGSEPALEARGWLLGALAGDGDSEAEIRTLVRFLENRAVETAGMAEFASSYSDGAHLVLHSSRRADAVVLEGLIAARPQSDLVAKVVHGLLAHRVKGRWGNTQENAFVLLALDRYFQTYEARPPNFTAKAWLGKAFAGEHRFQGHSTERHHVAVPMAYLAAAGGEQDLVLSREGWGRLYYRLGLRYAPADLKLAPADHGFTVERRYEPVDAKGDVRRDPDGVWRVRAGAMVKVTLTMVAPSRRYHVALVDPLPAGLEALNPALAVTGSLPPRTAAESTRRGRGFWWWNPVWYEHQNLRDERAEAFASLLWPGVHTYSYFARATTPGTFVVPPPKAEEMYQPETFGRGGSDVLVVQ